MKKHNTVKVVLAVILLFMLLSWIFPAAYYSSEYVDQGRVQMGLFDLFNYPLTALSYFGYIACFVVLVGGFYGILYKIPAYRSFLDKIVTKSEGKEKIVLSIIVIIFALLVSICGLQFGLALFIPFVVALILMMGYDKIVAALVIVGSMTVGLAGSTYAYQNLSTLTSNLSLDLDYNIGVRFIILLVGVILVIFNTFMYIKKSTSSVRFQKTTAKKVAVKEEVKEEVEVKKVSSSSKNSSSKNSKTSKSSSKGKTTSKSSKSRKSDNKAALKDEDVIVAKNDMSDDLELVPEPVSKNHKVWPFVLSFVVLFIITVLAFITWGDSGFGVSLFDDVTTNVTDFELFGFPIFSKLLGTVSSFGNWSITDMFLPMALVVLLLALIYKVKLSDILDGFAEGAKKALAPALIVILMYTILVIVTYHPYQLVIYKAIIGLTKGFNVATTTLVAILAGFFNSDIQYSFQSVLPYYVSVITNSDNYATVGIIFQAMYGLTMLVAPTSLVLMGTLSYLNVSYKEWLKNIWKLLLELFVILLIIFIILALI
jgi:uncharacterized ion transporter superfamily protein YfcC